MFYSTLTLSGLRGSGDHMVVRFTTTYAITTNVVCSNPSQARCTRYNIM